MRITWHGRLAHAVFHKTHGRGAHATVMFTWIVLILLLVLIAGSVPAYPHSRRWGYYPSGGFAVLLIILLLLWWFSLLPWMPQAH